MSHSHSLWPILKRYDGAHLTRIALPLGGIGTGTISLGGRGDLRDFEIVNRPAKGFAPQHTFFALWAKREGEAACARVLEGPIDPALYEGSFGCRVPNHGLPRFREASFEAAYPFGRVVLSDRDVPLQVAVEAFNPLVPCDADKSGWPLAALRFVLKNDSAHAVEAAVCGNLQNFIGSDGTGGAPNDNVNQFRDGENARGVFLSSRGVPENAAQHGTMALALLGDETALTGARISHRTAWANLSWGDALLDLWDDFLDDGALENRESDATIAAPMASLAALVRIEAASTRTLTFVLAWHFPNRQSWTPGGASRWLSDGANESGEPTIGNFYTTQFRDAWDVAEKAAVALPALEEESAAFTRAFCASDFPESVKEAALFNLSTLRTQTCFRTPDGYFYGWEGIHDRHGSCFGSCTHVWNYEQATAFLFGDLARKMREIEFLHATAANGLMSFRIGLPLLENGGAPDELPPGTNRHAAADGQMGCLMKLYRDWKLCGDDEWLRKLWPSAQRVLAFCWIEGGWDADRDGVMEGCQHNTMDVEYFGPNPQMGAWYLGALRAMEEMARHLGEYSQAEEYRALFQNGSRWMDENLWNGAYYEHRIVAPAGKESIAAGLRIGVGTDDLNEPDLQLGSGCLVDQLVGQFMAHVCGLGYLLDENHVKTTLQSILKFNFREDFYGHFNHMRSFVLGDESALLMASYPLGRRPRRPFPYYNEVMTGFEYVAAVEMLQEGQTRDGLRCIENIRARYDGHKRSPFDEAECGHHYARAMASWAAILALSGFQYAARDATLRFAATANESRVFWSNGTAWGMLRQSPQADGAALHLEVGGGAVRVQHLHLTGCGSASLPQMRVLAAGETLEVLVRRDGAPS